MTEALQLDPLAQARILVRVPNWVGDAVMCLPALEALRRTLPEAAITLLARPWVADLFPADALRCSLVAYDTTAAHRGLGGRWRIAGELRRERYDAAILFQNAFDAAWITWLAAIPIRAGYSRHGRRPLLTHPVKTPQKGSLGHEAHSYLELLRRLGIISSFTPVEQIRLPCTHDSRHRSQTLVRKYFSVHAENRFAEDGLIVGISPGATFGTAKRWPAARFAELAARLHREHGAACVFFGAPAEQALAEQVISMAGVPALCLAGKTSLAQFIELIPGCDLFVTNDTGTMHVAASLGVPTLAIFGSTNEHETRPLGKHVEVVVGEAFCRPCKLRHCPIDHRCMTSIEVDQVLEAARRMLRSQGAARNAPLIHRQETR
jgi:heptosyltransferase-2